MFFSLFVASTLDWLKLSQILALVGVFGLCRKAVVVFKTAGIMRLF